MMHNRELHRLELSERAKDARVNSAIYLTHRMPHMAARWQGEAVMLEDQAAAIRAADDRAAHRVERIDRTLERGLSVIRMRRDERDQIMLDRLDDALGAVAACVITVAGLAIAYHHILDITVLPF